jgi:protein AbiQ
VIVERNHVNLKKAFFSLCFERRFFVKDAMEFHRLSAAFYAQFAQYEEILTKENRPYYVLILEIDGLTYAVPLRSHITHPYCFIADNTNGQNSGLDFSKAF